MAAVKNPVILRIIVKIFAVYHGIRVSLKLFKRVFEVGFGNFMYIKERPKAPASLTDETHWTHHTMQLESSGVKIHYVAAGKEGAPLMLFLHGFPEFWYSWRHQLKEFSKDFRAVAIDMRGYARSDRPEGIEKYTVDELARDVHDVIRGLGYAHCVLVSHDWGGAVAYNVALLYPDDVSKMIVCNAPHPKAMEKLFKTSKTQRQNSWYMFFFQLPWLPELWSSSEDLRMVESVFTGDLDGKHLGVNKPGSITADDIEAYKYTFCQPGAMTPPINYYRASMRYRGPRIKDYTLRMPLLIVWGDKDTALETTLAELSASYGQKAVVRYVVGCSHWVQQEEPEIVNDYMQQFLKENSN